MGNRKTKYIPKSWESTDGKIKDGAKEKPDISANIYESMMLSDSFISLTNKQQILYLYCKAQYFGKRKPGRDHPGIEDLQGDDLFYLNWNVISGKYHLYRETSHKNFYQDMGVLCEHGFIEKVSSGKGNRKKTIYRYSDKWRDWKPG